MKKTLLLGLVALLTCLAAIAQKPVSANSTARTVTPTNAWTAFSGGGHVTDITVHNNSASDLWMLVFDSPTNEVAGAVPTLPPIKVTAGSYQSYFWTGGRNFKRGVTVMTSTTNVTLTNSTASFMIDVAYYDHEY